MKLRQLGIMVIAGCLFAPFAFAKNPLAMYPKGYQMASKVSKIPEFVPGLGTLYIDPKLLPVGPYVGYDKDGKLINAVYMIPVSMMEKHREWLERGTAITGIRTDHVDITFHSNAPGMSEPHYRIVQWVIKHELHQQSLAKAVKGSKTK